MKTVKSFNVKEKRVLLRCDFNVPTGKDGEILDDFRIKRSLPTIEYLIKKKARIILMSHLDNPDGSVTWNLDKIRDRLKELLKTDVKKSNGCIGRNVEEESLRLKPGEVLLLENLRFYKEEFSNEKGFAKELSLMGDIFINDAFAVCHREHASVVGVPKYLPKGAGFLLLKEVENLKRILKKPKKPMVVLIGGKNAKTKSKFIEKISHLADYLLVNGPVKREVIEEDLKLINKDKVISPKDDLESFDIDEEAIKIFQEKIMKAKTVLWNGPFGRFEDKIHRRGTLAVANAIIKSRAFSVVGGGETIEFLNQEGIISKFNWVSTGGGAMLAFLAGEKLPGLEALDT